MCVIYILNDLHFFTDHHLKFLFCQNVHEIIFRKGSDSKSVSYVEKACLSMFFPSLTVVQIL